MEQKKRKLTRDERVDCYVDRLVNQKVRPMQFLRASLNKLDEKAYRLDWLQEENGIACEAMMCAGKCCTTCDRCFYHQGSAQIAYEISAGIRKNPKYIMDKSPRITNGAEVYEHMTMKELKEKHDSYYKRQVKDYNLLLSHAKASMKNTLASL